MPWRDSIGVTGDRNYASKSTMPTPVRIQRSRQSKQESPNGLPIIYVGRPTKYGNPFRVEEMYKDKNGIMLYGVKIYTNANERVENILIENCRPAYERKISAIEAAVKCFEIYSKDVDFSELKGYNLSCWCGAGKPCHGDVILKKANK